MRLELSIDVRNDDGGNSYFSGEPIYFTVTLTNKTAREHYEKFQEKRRTEVGKAVLEDKKPSEGVYATPEAMVFSLPASPKSWVGAVDLRMYKQDEKSGTRMQILSTVDWSLLVTRTPTLKEMKGIGVRPVFGVWCLSPEHSRQLTFGRYELQARYDTSGIDKENVPRGDLAVAKMFRIVKPKDKTSYALKVSHGLAKYYLKAKRPDKALEQAKKALSIDASYDLHLAYTYLAQAYEEKKMWNEAIEAYEQFLKHHGDSQTWNYPAVLKTKVQALRSKLKEQKGRKDSL